MLKSHTPSTLKRIPGEVRKASIIRSAAALFAEKGFSGTKTREIAARAGVSEALIFKHFPSKHELYAAILAEKSPVPQLLSRIKQLAQQRKDREVFTVIAETIVRGAPDQNLMRLILFSALESHELSDMFFQNHIKVFYEFLAGYIEDRIQDGVFQPVPPLIAARSFMGMLIYHRLLTVLFGAKLRHDSQEIVQTFVTVFMEGLRKNHMNRPPKKVPAKQSQTKRKPPKP